MATYTVTDKNEVEIDFHGVKPDFATRNKMKSVRIWWNPEKMVWHGTINENTLAVAKEICGENVPASKPAPVKKYVKKAPPADFALKLKIRDIINADNAQLEEWERKLKEYVDEVMTEDNASHSHNAVSKSQESVWNNCFKFIASNLCGLNSDMQEYELIFE